MKEEILIMIELRYLELGIIPETLNLKKALDSMGEEESRKARRKFRKLHRKLKAQKQKEAMALTSRNKFREKVHKYPKTKAEREKVVIKRLESLEKYLGAPESRPNYGVRQSRKRHVKSWLVHEVIHEFEDAE